MEIIRLKEFTASSAWTGRDIANMNGIKTKLRWTDQPYKWHTNNGEEVFVVLEGLVEMFYKEANVEKSVWLNAGDIFFASVGTEHFAHPKGEAKLLIVEDENSE
ncbi:MAG: mannose-6-phosphate isomerase-like protein (cupin superfamily) [Candidatus Endobugula sp.]|jgi:mannose-6-phosphate isomerase-like protein (cupin superfamily)